MNDQNSRSARLRYTATGALAALAVVGAIAGANALAAKPPAKEVTSPPRPATAATKTPASPVPDKTDAPQPGANPQSFLNAIQQLVDNGTITAAEGQAVDREIQQGRVDTQTLTGRVHPGAARGRPTGAREHEARTRRERALDAGGEGVIDDAADVRVGAGNPRWRPA